MRSLPAHLFLFVLTSVSGCHYFGAPASKTPFGEETGVDGPYNQVANAFLNDLKGGRFAEAYARTSDDYQKQINADQFIDIMKRNPFPSGSGIKYSGTKDQPDPHIRRYEYREELSSGRIEFTLEVSRTDNAFHIRHFSLK
ncbi:MAG: hypothetical protein JNJ77_20530 [Planctomycetia bacterium]|nr:hypothetical protein [Planctomycetia bacterium]